MRRLALVAALSAVVLGALGLHAGTVEAGSAWGVPAGWSAPPDSTDSTDVDSLALDSLALDAPALDSLLQPDALPDPDSLAGDSARADTTDTLSTERAERYLPGLPDAVRRYSASVVPPQLPGIRGRLGAYWRRTVTLDSAAYVYTVREAIGNSDVRAPADATLDAFVVAQREAAVSSGFRTLAQQRSQTGRRRQGVGFTVDIPGGQQSAFRTLFGRNEVDLTVSGRSDVDVGVAYNASTLNQVNTGRAGTIDPAFGQQLNLNVAGTIGDKLRINVNYDTQNQFEFENQVSLVYTGYADDIIQRIEAGNVLLQTPSELIRGGQRLFGLRTDLQFGPLAVTAVASQQDAETTSAVFEGGSQSTPFARAPFEYEDNTHFFLGYFFHNWWDAAHRQPGLPTNPPGVNQITNIEVWRFDSSVQTTQTEGVEIINAVALVDLAEPIGVRQGGVEYLGQFPDPAFTPRPDSTIDEYDEALLETLRSDPQADIAALTGLAVNNFASNRFRRLQPDLEYTYDNRLGWLSLTTPLGPDDALAVAYEYTTGAGQQTVYVGDFGRSSQTTTQNGRRTILKLLRGSVPSNTSAAWDLTMRNVYRVGGRGLSPDAFELDVTYQPPGQSSEFQTLPTVDFGNQQTLLQTLGLDRVNAQNAAQPDNRFDFLDRQTVDAANGRVIFPVRQPFGDFLRTLILTGRTLDGSTIPVSPVEGSLEDAVALYTFPVLYDESQSQASRTPGLSRYQIGGVFRSASQSVFNVGFNIVPNTVIVTSGGRRLVENTDYRVNASAGTVEIINPTYLAPGAQIRVEAEQNRLFAIGSKTLLGLRADYRFGPDAGLGLTWMRLSERPLADKFRVGEEALQNTIYGLDGRYIATPRWITRAVDWLPLLQTRAQSRFEVRGEVAVLNPGHPETLAFERTRRALADSPDGIRLPDDELSGVSYVEDFDVSDNSLQLGETAGWRLAAAPDSAGPRLGSFTPQTPVTDPARPTNWRGRFAWYTINREVYRTFSEIVTLATQPITVGELFPERGFTGTDEENQPVGFLDLYFDPTDRGPYNYNANLGDLYSARPQDVWGGMVRAIDGSYADFEGDNNVEFVEMLVAPLGGRDGNEPIAETARLYVDLGRLNEDVVPDRQLSTEDGLPDRPPTDNEVGPWGRISGVGQPSLAVDFFRESGRTEDVGLDGLPSRRTDVAPGGQEYSLDEQTQFAAFFATVPDGVLRQRAAADPSADDYHHFAEAYFDDPQLYPGGASLQERFSSLYAGLELNSVQAYSEIVQSGREGISNRPDTEDVNADGQVTLQDARYHRYELPLNADALAAHPFVQGTITAVGQTFYLVRIPVRSTLRTSSGLEPDDFDLMDMVRLWTTGHDRPATMRIASLRLVGSQWLKSDRVGTALDPSAEVTDGMEPALFIESVNNEDSPDRYAIPRTAVRKEVRSASGQVSPAREASIVFRAEGLDEGRSAGIVRTYNNPFDLTRYTNVRMFVHGDAFERSDSVTVFLRLGDDETENYYEYEQPVYPYDPLEAERLGLSDASRSDSLWQTNVRLPDGTTADLNSVNIVLSELNRLKVARDDAVAVGDAGASVAAPYEGAAAPEGAPPGARIRIVGQPSIQQVRTIVMGVRNGRGGAERMLDTVQVWFNELRVSGYDEAGGASGFVTTTLQLADVANLTARYSFTQDGFGELGGGLGTRDFADRSAFSFSANVSAHRLLPERFGWSIPVNFTLNTTGQTPRFDPDRGDIRLDEQIDAILADTSAAAPPDAERRLLADALLERAQTATSSRNFRVQVSKTRSRSPWLRYTLDGLQLAYTANATDGRSPALRETSTDQWGANVSYRLAVPRPRTVRPFWFADGVPLVGGAIAGLRFNWLPQSLSFLTDLNRNVQNQQPRARLAFRTDPDSVVAYRTRRLTTQSFTHGRTFDLQYNPLSFLRLAYGSDVDQDFGAAGQQLATRVLVYRPATDSTDAFIRSYALTQQEAALDSLVRADLQAAFGAAIPSDGSLPSALGILILGGESVSVRPFNRALSSVFAGDGVRTRGYTQNLQGTLTVTTRRIRQLGWLRPQPVSYQANFRWTDITPSIASEDLVVAGVQSQARVQLGLQLVPRDFWRLFPFYRRLEAAAGATPPRATAGTPAGRPSAQTPAAAPDSAAARRGFDPGRALTRLPRTLFLAVTGITDVTTTYRGTFGSSAAGLTGGAYSLLSGLTGSGPSLPFRFGFARRLPLEGRFNNDSLRQNFEDRLNDQHVFEARTQLEPFRQLRVGLVMQTQFTRDETTPYSYPETEPGVPSTLTRGLVSTRGTGASSVHAFGASYESLLARHAERLRRDLDGTPDGQGRIVSEALARTGLADDFLAEFGRGLARYGPRRLFAVPLPGWDVTYSGLSSWPVFRSLTTSVTLRHNYSASAQSVYQSFTTPPVPRLVGGTTIVTPAVDGPSDEATSVTSNQAFQPLIGLQVTWRGGLQTTLNFERSDNFALQAQSAQVTEKTIENIRLEVQWSRTGLRLFGRRRLNNNLTFNMSGSIADDVTFNRSLADDAVATVLGRVLNPIEPVRLRRYQLSPRIGYTISNQVTASLFVTYARSAPENNTLLPTTDFDGGVSLRILFSN